MAIDLTVVPEMRTSERALFKRCPWAWRQAYRFGVRKKRASDALWFGELQHIALAAWYCGPGTKRGPHPAETFAKLAADELRAFKTADATEDEVAHYTDMRDLGVIMLDGYVDRYGIDDNWSVISPEQTFSFDIPFPSWWGEDVRKTLVRYVGTFDLVYRDLSNGWIYLGEHKTAKSIRTDHLPLDEQAGSYWAIAHRTLVQQGLIKPSDVFKGIMYNFLRKGLPDGRPVDKEGYACNTPTKAHYLAALDGTELTGKETLEKLQAIAAVHGIEVLGDRSKVQPAPLFKRHFEPRTRAAQRAQLMRIQNDAANMEVARRGEIAVTKTTHWSCARLCDLNAICRLHEEGGDWKGLRKVAYTIEDPYAAHRKSTEEMGTFEL